MHHGRVTYVTRWRVDSVDGKKTPKYSKRWVVPTEQEAIKLYAAWLDEWETHEHIRNPRTTTVTTVADLCVVYHEYAQVTYRKRGKPTSYVFNIKGALQSLINLYGDLPAHELTPPMLARVRDSMIVNDKGQTLARKTVNFRVTCIRSMYRWAADKGYVSAEVAVGLKNTLELAKGRSRAKEGKGVRQVHTDIFDQTIEHLPPVLQAMAKLQLATGCRPDEVCSARLIDIEMDGSIWLYRPADHKLAHMEDAQERIVFLGPKAQAIIKPYLQRDLTAFLFSPKEANSWRYAQANTHRRKNQKSTPRKSDHRVKDRYTTETYRRAIQRQCEKVFDPDGELRRQIDQSHRWSPNQLRHTYATQIRKQFGIEAASMLLGHTNLKTSQIYAEKSFQIAMDIARKVG
jgi:integrase